MTTLAPCSARARTTALPMPVLPPVTIATLPCSSSVMCTFQERPPRARSCAKSYRTERDDRKRSVIFGLPKSTHRLPDRHPPGYLMVTLETFFRLRAQSSQMGDAAHGESP